MSEPPIVPDDAQDEADPSGGALGLAPGRFYQAIVERMPIGVQVWRLKPARDPATARLEAANPAAARFTGVPIARSLGRALGDMFPEFCAQGLPDLLAEVLERRTSRVLGRFEPDQTRASHRRLLVRGFRLPNRCVGLTLEPTRDKE
jgi:PAS domain-containing protein